jgi:DNA-binding winged helix-turn-helix (wHTH) protein/Tol biopolymer transport system component
VPTRTAYRFSDLTLDTGPRRLERGGDPIELGKLTYALLVALVEASPNVVSHDELVQRVWGGRMTSPETVTQRIKLLRDALGDDAEQPRYIGLVRGQGYRLIPALARVKPQGWPAHVDPAPAHARRRGAVPVAVAVTLVLGAAGVLYIATRPTTPDPYVAARPAGDLEFSQLTATGNAVHPAISPDGRYVVYVRTAPNDRLNFESLWVRQIAASTHIEIVPAQPNLGVAMPTVSPDGNFVDFLRLKPEGGPALWRVPILGGAPRLIAERVFSAVGWSPDGRQMAFIREETSGNALVIADAEGRGERVLATRHVPAYFLSLATVLVPDVRPAWSPDGRVIALFEYRDLETLLVLVDTATGAETVRDPGGSYFPQGVAWLGPQALVLSQPEAVGKNQQLWRLSYPEAVVSRLTNDMATYVGLGVDRTGASVVTSRSETRVTVWAGDAAWVESAKISRPLLFGGSIAWVSWAGERVLFDTTINDRSGVAAVTPGEDAEPTEILGDAVQGVATSDGSTFIFIRGTEGLWQADAEGRPPRQLVTGDGLAVEPRITPDDRSVIFLSSRSGVMSPWIVPVGGGEPNEIVRTNTAILDVSHDGRRLLFASGDERNAPIVVTCDLPACTNRREHAFPANYTGGRGRIRFMPDGQGIAYVGGRGATNLWTMSLEGGAPTQLTHFADQAVETDGPIARFAFSHDGERLALTRIKTTSDIVLVRGLQN